eukprot:m.20332 g.20332  ORF g.20332 m.20332 type:complete len:170 (-) comp12896_c0_seq1:82-591(-)
MPPKKKKGKKGDAPPGLKVKVHLHHIGPGGVDPIDVDVAPSCSLFAVKHILDKVASTHLKTVPGSLIFGSWHFRECVPSYMSPSRRVCHIDPNKIYDAAWISTLGVAPESCVSLHRDPTNDTVTVEWYTNMPQISNFKEKPTPQELAKIAYEKSKIIRAEASKKKKKKK